MDILLRFRSHQITDTEKAFWMISMASDSSDNVGNIMQCEDYSTWSRLLWITAYVFRAVKIYKGKLQHDNHWVQCIEYSQTCWRWQLQPIEDKPFEIWKKQFTLFFNENDI